MRNLIRKILKESEDDLGWAEEVVNSPIKDVIEGQYYRCNGREASEPFYYKLDIFVKEIQGSVVIFDSLTNSDDPNNIKVENAVDKHTTYNNAKKLVEGGYWMPISKEESLFHDYGHH